MAPKVWLLLAGLLLLPLVQNKLAQGQTEVVGTLELDVTGSGDNYSALMVRMWSVLVHRTTTGGTIKKVPILGLQTGPQKLLYIDLKAGRGGQSTTLAIKASNVYLVGFKNAAGSWYTFKFDSRYIQGSTDLGFEGNYTALTGKGGAKNLRDVDIGKTAAQEAVAVLAAYTAATPQEETKKAITRLVVMLCEASRFKAIRASVKAAWDDGGKLPQVGVDLVLKWRETSCAVLVWSRIKKPKWMAIEEVKANKLDKLGDPKMDSVDAAVANLYLIIRPTTDPLSICSDGKTA